MAEPVRIALVGAGLIGRRHAEALQAAPETALACVVDPSEAGRAVASEIGAPWFADLPAMLEQGGVEGALLATPNQLHAEGAETCLAAGLPTLVEKPIAATLAEGRRMIAAAEAAGVPLAVGHHRRHNPLIVKAKALVDEGRLGRITAVQASVCLIKPEDYFAAEWRRRTGAGPVYINLIHDVDLLQCLCGPVVEVQAMESSAARGFDVEDTAAILLRFASGALGTVVVSDAAAAPWSWEQTARENDLYPATPEDCYRIAGTHGALSLPNLALWTHPEARDWRSPISETRFPYPFADPLIRQASQFAAVIRGEAAPLVSGRDGLAALAVVEAVKQAATQGRPVAIDCG